MPHQRNLCKNNPLIPYRARPGRGPCVLTYPYNLETAKQVILNISTEMGRQCISCHRYITSPPQANLHHHGGPPGPECSLPHHPAPCSWIGPRGQPCPYVHPPPVTTSPLPPLPLSPPAPSTQGDLLLMQQLEQLRREKEDSDRRAELLQVANNNLRANQLLLAQQQVSSSLPISSVSSTATTTTSSFSSLSSRPAMGTGFSVGFGTTTMASSVASASVAASLTGAAQSLAARNLVTPSKSHSIPAGYSGPTVPDLRLDAETAAVAQRVLVYLQQQIPALAPDRSP